MRVCAVSYIYLLYFFFFSSRRRHTRFKWDWSSDVCSSDLLADRIAEDDALALEGREGRGEGHDGPAHGPPEQAGGESRPGVLFEDDRRDQEPRGEEDDGSRAVAADADDQRRPGPDQDEERMGERQRQGEEAPEALEA